MTEGRTVQPSGWRMLAFSPIGDSRGWLVSLESDRGIPFVIRRVYYIFGTRTEVRRGMHAHHQLEQVAVCVSGSCKFLIDDGSKRQVVRLLLTAKKPPGSSRQTASDGHAGSAGKSHPAV